MGDRRCRERRIAGRWRLAAAGRCGRPTVSDDDALRDRWLELLRAEHRARYGEADRQEAVQYLATELGEMMTRLLPASPSPGPRRDAALATELAGADRERIEELRAQHDLSPAEATALVLAVDPKAAMRLLRQYAAHLR